MISSSLASLPAELLAQIFSYLPAKDIVLSVQLVNKLFQHVFTQSTWLNRIVAIELAGLEWNPLFNADLPSHQVLSSETKQLPPPPESLSTSTIALSLVQSREHAWSSFNPKFLAKLEVKHAISSLYDVVAGHYILGRSLGGFPGLSGALKYHRLPGRGDEDLTSSSACAPVDVPSSKTAAPQELHAAKDDGPFVWKELNVPGKMIRDFGTALEEHDLIVLVTSCPCQRPTSTRPPPHIQTVDPNALDPKFYPHPTNAALIEDYFDTSESSGPGFTFQAQPLDTEFFSLQIHLAHFSTGQPHTEADLPILPIHVYSKFWNHPSISVEVVGKNLAIIVQYDDVPSLEWCGMLILDWKKGHRKSPWIPVDNSALVFLSEDLLLHPNRKSAALDIYHIDSSQPRSSPVPEKGAATSAGVEHSAENPQRLRSRDLDNSNETDPLDPNAAENDDAHHVISSLYPGQSAIPGMSDEDTDSDPSSIDEIEEEEGNSVHGGRHVVCSDEDDDEEGDDDIQFIDLVHTHGSDDDEWIDEDDKSETLDDGDDPWMLKPKSFSSSISSSSSSSSDIESKPKFQNVPRWLHHPAIRHPTCVPPPRPFSSSSRPIQSRDSVPAPTESTRLRAQLDSLGIGPDVDGISAGKGKSKLKLVKRLKLPALRKSRRAHSQVHQPLFNISCRGEPNPSGLRSILDREAEKEVILSRLMGRGQEQNATTSDDATSTSITVQHSTPPVRLPYANPARPFNANPSKAMILFQAEFVLGGIPQTLEFIIRREELKWFVRGFGRSRGAIASSVPGGSDEDTTRHDDGMGFDGCYCRTGNSEEEHDLGERVRRRIESRMRMVMDVELEKSREQDDELIDKSRGAYLDLDKGKSIVEIPIRDKGKQKKVPRGVGEERRRKKRKPTVANGSRKVDDVDPEGGLGGDRVAKPGPANRRGRLQKDTRQNRTRKSKKKTKQGVDGLTAPNDATSIGATVPGPSHAPPPDASKSAVPQSPTSPSQQQPEELRPQAQLIYTWQEWGGPWLTRWFNSDAFSRNYITTSCGERYVRYMDRWVDHDESNESDDLDAVDRSEEAEARLIPMLNVVLGMGAHGGVTVSMGGPSGAGGVHVGDGEVHDAMFDEVNMIDDDDSQSTHSGLIIGDFDMNQAQNEMMETKKYGIVLIDFNESRVGKEIVKRKELSLMRARERGGDAKEETEPYLGWIEEEKCYKRVVVGAMPSSTKPKSRRQRGSDAIPVWTHPEARAPPHIARYLETLQGAHKQDRDPEGGSAEDQPRRGNSLRDVEVDEVWKERDAAFLGAMHNLTKRPLYEDDLPSYKVRLAKKLELQAEMTDGELIQADEGDKRDDRHNQFDDGGLFVSEVVSTLPFIEIVSKEKFEFESISLEDERILGFELDETGSVASDWVDVLYFG